MPLVSVIVPVYNVEKYISKCLESVKAQTLTDFECLIVSDGSKDNSIELAKEIISSDDRFRIIEKENGGYGSVLELAIKEFRGEYLLICDPDDYLKENALQELYSYACNFKSDITIGTRILIYEGSNDSRLDLMYDENKVKLISNHLYRRNESDFHDIFLLNCAPHSKLYSRRVIERANYPKKISYTDNILFYTSLNNADAVFYTETPYAFYLQNRPGNSVSALRSKYILDHIDVYSSIIDLLDLKEKVDSFIYFVIFYHFKILFYNMKLVEDDIESIKDKLYALLGKLIKHKDSILKYQEIYQLEEKRARFKNKLLLSKSISRGIYKVWLWKILKSA